MTAAPGASLLPSRHTILPEDRDLFGRHLASFVPPKVFDFHAHVYPLAATGFDHSLTPADHDVDLASFRQSSRAWMGDRAPQCGLFFGIPSSPRTDTPASNRFASSQTREDPHSRFLWLTRPGDDPATTESSVRSRTCGGFKVYHTFCQRPDTPNASPDEYCPEWIWQLADRHQLLIMLHLVRPRALADESNQSVLRRRLRRYPGARLILAHAARGFSPRHTLEGLDSVAEFENVFFDTSAICDAVPFLAVLQRFGPFRLLYGSDHPISLTRGRPVSLGDSFTWLTPDRLDSAARPTLVGIESLLALQSACRLARLSDGAVESIFSANADRLLKP